MRFKRGEDGALFFADGRRITAQPQFSDAEPTLLLWLTTDRGDTVEVLDEDAGRFALLRTGAALFADPPT